MQQKDVARRMGISTQRYSILENNENRPLERTNEILRSLSFTESSARTFLDSILLIIKKSDRPFWRYVSQPNNNLLNFIAL